MKIHTLNTHCEEDNHYLERSLKKKYGGGRQEEDQDG